MKRNRTYRFMTITEVAERLHSMSFDEGLDFTFDSDDSVEEPTGWNGFKKVLLFDEPHRRIAMGYYGISGTGIYCLQDDSVEEYKTGIRFLLDNEYYRNVNIICVEIPAIELWKEFGEVPMNPETECIETEWNGFPIGTHREEIWYWFEETYCVSVAEYLMHL